LQWNARSIIANGLEFKRYVDQQDKKPNNLHSRNVVKTSPKFCIARI